MTETLLCWHSRCRSSNSESQDWSRATHQHGGGRTPARREAHTSMAGGSCLGMAPTGSHGREAAFLAAFHCSWIFTAGGEGKESFLPSVPLSTYSELAGCRILRPGPTYRTSLCVSHLCAREHEKRWPSSPDAPAGARRCSKGEARGRGAHGDRRFKCDLRSLSWVLHPVARPYC